MDEFRGKSLFSTSILISLGYNFTIRIVVLNKLCNKLDKSLHALNLLSVSLIEWQLDGLIKRHLIACHLCLSHDCKVSQSLKP